MFHYADGHTTERLATESTGEALDEADNNEKFLERSSEEGLTKPRSYIAV